MEHQCGKKWFFVSQNNQNKEETIRLIKQDNLTKNLLFKTPLNKPETKTFPFDSCLP